MANIDISKLTIEQKVVLRLAEMGIITSAGDIQRAMKEFQYANYLVTPIQDDGKIHPDVDADGDGIPDSNPSKDDIINAATGVPDGDCDHEALTNDDIQEVFDNDENK